MITTDRNPRPRDLQGSRPAAVLLRTSARRVQSHLPFQFPLASPKMAIRNPDIKYTKVCCRHLFCVLGLSSMCLIFFWLMLVKVLPTRWLN